ncbi:MAG: hypothetical protein WCU00_08995 [Candidatus Latescibacterota bacterium]
MIRIGIRGVVALVLVALAGDLCAQNIYELHKLTEQQWLSMPTEQRLSALGMAVKQTDNQTFVGQFGRYQNIYKKWGYDFYEMNDQYENYAFRGYENYNVIDERRVRWSYNEFGDRIAKMRLGVSPSIYLWREVYSDNGTYTMDFPKSLSQYVNALSTQLPIDGVWVAKEGTNDWALSIVNAGAMRSKYSSLILSSPNINGTRIDLQTANNTLSFLSSAPFENQVATKTELEDAGGPLLRAGHFQRKMGILSVGASYANMYAAQGNRQGGNSWYGTVSNYTPTPMILALRVLDDSPDDGNGGPVVSNVRFKVNGHYRDDIIPQAILDDLTREYTSADTNLLESGYVKPTSSLLVGIPSFDFLSIEGRLPKFMDYFYLNDALTGTNRINAEKNFSTQLAQKYYQQVDPKLPVEVNGTQYIVYIFDISTISEQVQEVTAELTVCNDYLIQTAQIYTKTQTGADTGGKDPNAAYQTWYNSTYWRKALESEGNIKDKSNLKRVSVDFGVQVASVLYGVNADFNYRGLKISGEFATNSNHYMFPDDYPGTGWPKDVVPGQAARKGHKWAEIDHAYYVTAQKDWNYFGFAGEYFKMGNFYKPYLDYFYSLASGKEMSYAIGSINARNNTVRLPLVEDNDDNDQYPDNMFRQWGMGWNIQSVEDPDGVFPGNDQDNDGIPDNNKNQNTLSDYNEPFLMLDSDPDEFVFGNDFNNNNIPDFREDDMKLDTPYDLDRQGHHFYFRMTPLESINLVFGSMRTKGVGTDNRTNSDYFKLQLNYNVFGIGKLYAEYHHERIQDSIRDPYVTVSTQKGSFYLSQAGTGARFPRSYNYDELEYKNSSVDRLWIESAIRAIPSITIENHLKLENNNQLEGVMYDNTYQSKLGIHTIAMLNKISYSKSFGNWSISPGVKLRFYKKDRGQAVRFGEYYLLRIPVLMINYVISPRTDLTLGMQGIPGIEFTSKDYMQSENNFKQKTYSLQLQNRTVYFGYNIWTALGVRFDEINFDEDLRAFENYKSSTTYMQVFLGY